MNEKVGGNQVSEEECREVKKFEEEIGRDTGEETIDVKKIYKLIIDNVQLLDEWRSDIKNKKFKE